MYSDLEMDALREIGNIGAGNAATALSMLLCKKITIKVPQIKIIPFDEVSQSVGGPEKLVAGIFMRISGDIEGNILIVIPEIDAYHLTEILLNAKRENGMDFSEMEKSALLELGNIVGSSYVTALSDFTKLSLKISVPSFAFDMAGAIISFPLSLYGYIGDTAFLIDTEFTEGLDGIRLHYFLIPDDKSLQLLLKAIGVNTVEHINQSRNGRI
ncbi:MULTISPECIES: chemotaxis protein CheC [Tepidanaerobacter]|uniref:Chemotaxis protein CheC n=1 Tax=Tepidanaerobacter syntrophicus TaxID=224999 RepID=A0A0U9I614_9FIRM|nr:MULTISPECIES: chemotaxis protein CheC [Tepidanaerobacter]GAQ26232.1 chemotaxis protein CheC [Tepidanaerobacter syntrophicus]GLI19220.1 CheY-P-specific phosphatase CheC [Tepidanaerobacter syntrophicus]GLI50147.1 CheY-P-specific phosphatase CheC [Tepidanaerobacter syntrophicus]HHV83554.1 chemotaxis protein CheC [Tepidanaerobacter syntrophicus]